MRAEIAGKFILELMDASLPAYLCYHNTAHTSDVHAAAKRLAAGEGINQSDTDLLLTAAWFHDAGYLNQITGHEEQSCLIAKKHLPAFGFSDNEIEQVCGMIRATRLPQAPQNLLEQILADADLDYLGRDDFFETGDNLYQELLNLNQITTHDEWNRKQINFLENHFYFTKTAINSRQAKKEVNLAAIKALLSNK